MRDYLDELAVDAMIRRLCTAYGKPFGSAMEDLITLWFDKLRWAPASLVSQAVERWIESKSRFPTIDQIRSSVREAMPKTDAERNPGDEDRCPACRTTFWVAGYECGNGVVVGRRRCKCRQGGSGWDTEKARAYRDVPISYEDAKAKLKALETKQPRGLVPIQAMVTPPEDAGDAWEPTMSPDELAKRKAAFKESGKPAEVEA